MFKPRMNANGPIAVLIATSIPTGIGVAVQKAGTDPVAFYGIAGLTAVLGVFLLLRRNPKANHIRFSL